jgi:hypothetical protein
MVTEVVDSLLTDDGLAMRKTSHYKPSRDILTDNVLFDVCKLTLALFHTLEYGLGMIVSERVDGNLVVVGVSDLKIRQMYAYNTSLVYKYATEGRGVTNISRAPIRRWGFCNHFEWVLPALVERLLVLREDKTTAINTVNATQWLGLVHTAFLNQYLTYVSEQIKLDDAWIVEEIALTSWIFEAYRVAVLSYIGSLSRKDVASVIGLIECRLCNWDLNWRNNIG